MRAFAVSLVVVCGIAPIVAAARSAENRCERLRANLDADRLVVIQGHKATCPVMWSPAKAAFIFIRRHRENAGRRFSSSPAMPLTWSRSTKAFRARLS